MKQGKARRSDWGGIGLIFLFVGVCDCGCMGGGGGGWSFGEEGGGGGGGGRRR